MSTLPTEKRAALIKAAFQAKENSYSRYSHFPVGAAIMAANGQIIKGASIENASYGGTICAERTAIVKAVSDGITSFVALAVTSNIFVPITPCGMCRQVMREFCATDMPVLLVPGDYPKEKGYEGSSMSGMTEGGVKETTMGELFPDSFGPEQLELPRRN